MKILVMGAGVIGVTTAYQLLKDGHEVAVVESRESAREPAQVAVPGRPGAALPLASRPAPLGLVAQVPAPVHRDLPRLQGGPGLPSDQVLPPEHLANR